MVYGTRLEIHNRTMVREKFRVIFTGLSEFSESPFCVGRIDYAWCSDLALTLFFGNDIGVRKGLK